LLPLGGQRGSASCKRGGTSLSDVSPLTFVGIGLLAAYGFWLWAFFTHARPRIMLRIGRALDVRVRESLDALDAGTYDTRDDDAPLAKRGAVMFADIVVLLAGTVGTAALVFIPAFLIAEGGVLLALEGTVTGRRAVLDVPASSMTLAVPRVDASVRVRNDGRLPLQSCALVTSGYGARTGYVNGRSDYFDIGPGDARAVRVPLTSQRPVRGEHRIPLLLECENRRVAVAEVVLDVR
jgi:hypothetical protein